MNKHLFRIYILIFTLAVFSDFLFNSPDAMSWPSQNAVLVRNFGANNNGKPVLGMVFSGGANVTAAESGEVIFSRRAEDAQTGFAASRLPSPLGAWAAIDHGDGLISIYSRYSEKSDQTGHMTEIEKEQLVAVSGISGWSSQEGFYFLIFDRRDRSWINPAMIITPMQETNPPQILSVELRDTQGNLQSRNITQGRYIVFVNAAGGVRAAGGSPQVRFDARQIAPQRITCLVNGAEVGSLNFEAVSARDGILLVSRNGLVPVRQVYGMSPSFEAAEVFLARGQVTLEVIVQDINGASRSMINRLIVN